ncbi:fasciclin domain-containing protein [Arthrobacter sp. APC 3897]|uniref:fasciclin domain-containing protein n=1 Tax=Arthrobacter sp. APC 3897 TaxID=3035204 RepID=UPI0025B539D6|nr:fasciclin domain-containing protein [Arthrobacter sp. APC 3897]MDN3482974.1 fasciclin domain-containing protein [Arthrobacter sp. APC 3897]
MAFKTRRNMSILGIAAVSMLGMAACSTDSTDSSSTSSESGMASESMSPSASESMSSDPMASESMSADPAANLVGGSCADYAAAVPEGAGSIQGMSLDPVATAASNNPMLTTLTAAVSGQLNPDVNLVDTLNGSEFTVFAPTDDAFAKLDPATVETLKTDPELLSSILTYHVVPGQMTPDELSGMYATVNGEEVEVTGSGDSLMVNDAAVVCGGVQTENATVYLLDTVLMPGM